MDNSKIFVSYSRKDSEEFAERLCKDLRSRGLNIWFDKIDIQPGEIWDNEVEKALESSAKFLIILSPESVSSINVMDELNYALEEGKTVIPILYIDCKIPFRIRRRQYCDFTRNYDTGLHDLLKGGFLSDNNIQTEPYQQAIQIEPKNSILSIGSENRITWINEREGSFIDDRDNQKYNVIKIGNQVWMAENLAYRPNEGNFWALDDNPSNIAKFGYLYDWNTALKACPKNWRLPTKSDFEQLIQYLGGEGTTIYKALIEGGKSGFMGLLSGDRGLSG